MKRATRTLTMLCILYAGVANAQSLEQIEAYERRIDEQQQQLDAMREELEALKKMVGMQTMTAAKAEPAAAEFVEVDADDDARREPFVVSRSDNSVLTLGGRVHRVIMQVDDGASTNGFFMDSDQGPTMLRADIISRVSSDWTLAGALEIGIQSNRPFRVNQDNPNPGTKML